MKEFEIPTDQNPFELDKNCLFYSNYYIIDGRKVIYDDISQILWSNSKQSMNGFEINSKTDYFVYATKSDFLFLPSLVTQELSEEEQEELLYAFDDFSFEIGLIKTQRSFLKRQIFIHNFLYEKTRESRIRKTINTLKNFGFIEIFEGAKLYDNGDVAVKDNHVGNFRSKFESNELINGVKYGGYSNKVYDPYEFGFKKGSKFFGLIEDNFVFRNIINTDIFEILLSNLFKNGNLSKF